MEIAGKMMCKLTVKANWIRADDCVHKYQERNDRSHSPKTLIIRKKKTTPRLLVATRKNALRKLLLCSLQILRYCCLAQTVLCWAVRTGSPDEFHRTENNNAAKHINEVAAARPRAAKTECFTMMAPSAAPNTIANIEPVRRCQRGLLPPAREESAARPVTVSVSTVVVRSGTPSFRTAAFLIPIATAVRTMI